MLQHDGRRFKLYPWKAKYQGKNGNQKEKWALPDKAWWESAAERQGFQVEFEEIELTEEQQERYNQVRSLNIPEQFRTDCINYILDDVFPEGFIHYLRDIELAQEQKQQDMDIADAYYEIMSGGGE